MIYICFAIATIIYIVININPVDFAYDMFRIYNIIAIKLNKWMQIESPLKKSSKAILDMKYKLTTNNKNSLIEINSVSDKLPTISSAKFILVELEELTDTNTADLRRYTLDLSDYCVAGNKLTNNLLTHIAHMQTGVKFDDFMLKILDHNVEQVTYDSTKNTGITFGPNSYEFVIKTEN